jgi:hypothetical protein
MKALPKDDAEKQKLLSELAEKFEIDKIYKEDEVNEIIDQEHFNDHALVRREMVNFGYFEKDSYKGEYKLKKRKLSEEELNKIKQNQEKMKEGNVY